MKKIPTLFQRNYYTDRLVRNEITPGCEWVINGEGWPTRKLDGTCCMIKDGALYKRYKAKKEPPENFIPAQEKDPVTFHWVGWLPCDRNNSSDKYHWEAFDNLIDKKDGTYELLGPKVQGNPEKWDIHELICHQDLPILQGVGRDFDSIREYLSEHDFEGIVWHSKDSRYCKIKKRDFGLKRRNGK